MGGDTPFEHVKELQCLSVSEFSEFLATKFDDDIVQAFEKNKISASVFLLMTDNQIGSLVPAIGDVILLHQLQRDCRQPTVSPQSTPVALKVRPTDGCTNTYISAILYI